MIRGLLLVNLGRWSARVCDRLTPSLRSTEGEERETTKRKKKESSLCSEGGRTSSTQKEIEVGFIPQGKKTKKAKRGRKVARNDGMNGAAGSLNHQGKKSY